MREESTTFTAPLSALTNYFNLSSSSGAGNDFAQCLAAHCGACFRATEQNVCPTVSALSVDSSVYLGSSGHVSALASDPDQAPGALRYEWSVEPTTAAVFGDANAASTTFDCVTTGSAQVRLLVSDGDAACDWTFSRRFTCYDAPCLFNPLLASARAAFVGESISLSVAPRAFVPLLVEWSAVPDDVGTLVGDESGAATYTCGSTGVFIVTAQSTQGSCSVPLTVSLTCTTPAPPEARIPDSTESALRRTYQGEDRQECWSCAAASPCLDAEAITACEWRADPAERVLCLRLLQCELESGCAQDGWSCYCNTSDGCFAGPSAGAGVCRAELEAALQTSNPNVVATHSTDPALPGAQATILAQCLAQSGCESCFPPRNRCPVIDSVSVDPSAATIGETIALRVTATDPDDGPNPVGYYWIASHTDAGFLGSIAEPSQAETSFTCERAETGEVVVTATDGLCGDVRYVPVTCLAGGG